MSLTIKQLNQKITALGKRTEKWRNEVQIILVGCAQFAFDDGNVDPCTRLVDVLKGADAKAVIHWIEKHMPARWVKAEGRFLKNKSFTGEYDPLLLLSEPWWELATKAKDVSSSLDVLDVVRSLVKRLEREVAAGTKVVEHQELIVKLKALANDQEYATIEG